jgi:acetate kinase
MRVLILNAGSSSLKTSIVETSRGDTLSEVTSSWSPDEGARETRAEIVANAIRTVDAPGGSPAAVGYRVVHGGTTFRGPTLIDDSVVARIEALDELAPLHNRIAAQTIQAARDLLPDAAHVACFDTAFHATLEEPAWRYPIPLDWYSRWGIRRFGFHGLSVAWAIERAAALLERQVGDLNLVVAHLGAGSSVTAVAAGRSVDTSMGFTPLEGLMMGTRSGSIDPGILIHLLRRGLTTEELADSLEHRSGLLGVSDLTADVADLERVAAAGDSDAALALAIYSRRAAAGMAAAVTALGRLDGIVFTGGIGEHSALVRQAISARLLPLGVGSPVEVHGDGDAIISSPGAQVLSLRIKAREDVVIARQTERLLSS